MAKPQIFSFSKEYILDCLSKSCSWKDFAKAMGLNTFTRSQRKSVRRAVLKKYGFDVSPIIEQHKQAETVKRKNENLNKLVICDNCGREYRNGDRLSFNKSGHYFCCDKCARMFSSNFNKHERRRKISQSLIKFNAAQIHAKRMCKICGAMFQNGKRTCRHPEICRHVLAFNSYVKYMGFDPSTLGSEKVYAEFNRLKSLIENMYFKDGMSTTQIYDKFKNKYGYPFKQGNFYKLLIHFLPKRRSTKAGQIQRLLYGPVQKRPCKDIKFKQGVHKTWTGETITYRSSYELDLCLELDQAEVIYATEPFAIEYFDSVQQRVRAAIPDFYLPEYNAIIEVKSAFTFKKQNMLDKINAYLEQGYEFLLEYEHKSYCVADVQYIETNSPTIDEF